MLLGWVVEIDSHTDVSTSSDGVLVLRNATIIGEAAYQLFAGNFAKNCNNPRTFSAGCLLLCVPSARCFTTGHLLVSVKLKQYQVSNIRKMSMHNLVSFPNYSQNNLARYCSTHMKSPQVLVGAIEAGGTKFVCAVGTGPDDVRAQERFDTTLPVETIAKCLAFLQRFDGLAAVGIAAFGPLDLQPASATYGCITSTPKTG